MRNSNSTCGTAIDQALDVDMKAIPQINFARYLDWAWNTAIFFILKKVKEIILDVFQRIVNCKYNFSRNCQSTVNVFSLGTVKALQFLVLVLILVLI